MIIYFKFLCGKKHTHKNTGFVHFRQLTFYDDRDNFFISVIYFLHAMDGFYVKK